MDRFSSLPNEIICHIGSFLSTKEAVFIMVLSKRYQNLFTIIPTLSFNGDEESFKDFVDGVLALPVTSRIRTFSLLWYHFEYDHINRCLCDVLKRGVLVIELNLKVHEPRNYSLPSEVFTCKTVVKMDLRCGFAIELLPEDAFLPSLKTLFLESVQFYDSDGCCAFQTLLSASPVLEELVIDNIEWERWKWSSIVSSPTLQRLTIRREEWFSYDSDDILDSRGLAYDFDSISLDTPSLIYLDYSDYVPKEYPTVNLNSLVEAKLDLRVDEEGVWEATHVDDFNPVNLISCLKNVEILDLTIQTTEMFSLFPEAIPVFEKLFQLSVSLSDSCWSSLLILIKKSPNLKTLIIEDYLHYGRREDEYLCECVSEYSFLSSCPVEVLKINSYNGSIEELAQMKHFLEKLSCLELVVVYAQVSHNKRLQVMADLQMLPRASSKCKFQVDFFRKSY
ncbi:hypothetical protein AALP_AA6G330900 [Arabis alpina]|uniref:FBD domain-containing protein n=1 Tax=Arabis alpina TaxID=50452 RepID=A0A087GT96_ARAAL|nr:hypothetical protein AALP_AA6G330900 [Arabis alpina]